MAPTHTHALAQKQLRERAREMIRVRKRDRAEEIDCESDGGNLFSSEGTAADAI